MSRKFRPYLQDQPMLLPPDVREWLTEGHLAYFVSDVVEALDITALLRVYESRDGRGQPPYHPLLLLKVLVYGYCTGVFSSRQLERATYDDIAMRVLAGNSHPDHDTIAAFRERHLEVVGGLFVQVLQLCERTGLVQLGQVALDGTKLQANASKHKAMSYGRMEQQEEKLVAEVERLLAAARQVDAAEDAQQGRGQRGSSVPAELARRVSRLAQIRVAKAALEAEARAQAEHQAELATAKIAAREQAALASGQRPRGRAPQVPDVAAAKPAAKAQRNFTDGDSRIMRDGATKSFVQGYNAQAVVDAHSQIIVAAVLTQEANDKQQLVPMLGQVQQNLGRLPETATADAGYWSAAAVQDPALAAVDLYVAVEGRQAAGRDEVAAEYVARAIASALGHDTTAAAAGAEAAGAGAAGAGAAGAGDAVVAADDGDAKQQMREKLQTPTGKAIYKRRKEVVEPVFGQIKEGRGFRRFSLRGKVKAGAEWTLVCLTHNLLKLFRASRTTVTCPAGGGGQAGARRAVTGATGTAPSALRGACAAIASALQPPPRLLPTLQSILTRTLAEIMAGSWSRSYMLCAVIPTAS